MSSNHSLIYYNYSRKYREEKQSMKCGEEQISNVLLGKMNNRSVVFAMKQII